MEWRFIKDYPGYEISDTGLVRTYHQRGGAVLREPKLLKPTKSKGGQLTFVLSKGGKCSAVTVTKLMKLAWFPNREGVAYHINGIKDDNRLENIGVIARSELMRQISTNNEKHKQPVAKVDKQGNTVEIYPTISEAAKQNYVSMVTVRKRCENKIKNAYALTGYTFRYAREMKGEGNGK